MRCLWSTLLCRWSAFLIRMNSNVFSVCTYFSRTGWIVGIWFLRELMRGWKLHPFQMRWFKFQLLLTRWSCINGASNEGNLKWKVIPCKCMKFSITKRRVSNVSIGSNASCINSWCSFEILAYFRKFKIHLLYSSLESRNISWIPSNALKRLILLFSGLEKSSLPYPMWASFQRKDWAEFEIMWNFK